MKGCNSWLDANGTRPNRSSEKLRHGDELAATGADDEEIARQLDVSVPTLYNWRKQYGGMKADDAKEFKELKNENALLKKLLAEAELEKAALKEIARKNSGSGRSVNGLIPLSLENSEPDRQTKRCRHAPGNDGALTAFRLQNRRATAIHPTKSACERHPGRSGRRSAEVVARLGQSECPQGVSSGVGGLACHGLGD